MERSSEHSQDRGPAASAPFEELWSSCAPAVTAWIGIQVRDGLRARIDPDDVLQEVAFQAFGSFERFDGNEGPFRAWVFGIARNVLYHAFQRVARSDVRACFDTERWRHLPDTTTSITRRVARSEEVANFVAMVHTLDDDDRRLLIRRGLEGLAHDEIAREFGISTDAAIKRWTRLRDRLSDSPSFVALAS